MKKLGIGEIARETGWPALIRQIEESEEPVVITRGNSSVALLLPCNDVMLRLLADMEGWGKVMKILSSHHEDAVKLYLLGQVMTGLMAKAALTDMGAADKLREMEDSFLRHLRTNKQPQKNRAEDSAPVGTDTSAAPVEGKGRRRKSPAKPKQSPPSKR